MRQFGILIFLLSISRNVNQSLQHSKIFFHRLTNVKNIFSFVSKNDEALKMLSMTKISLKYSEIVCYYVQIKDMPHFHVKLPTILVTA
jgi:hypothetical protein